MCEVVYVWIRLHERARVRACACVCVRAVTWVTEQQTGVSTAGGQGSLTDLATGVGQEPGVHRGVLHLRTVAHIPAQKHTRADVYTTTLD